MLWLVYNIKYSKKFIGKTPPKFPRKFLRSAHTQQHDFLYLYLFECFHRKDKFINMFFEFVCISNNSCYFRFINILVEINLTLLTLGVFCIVLECTLSWTGPQPFIRIKLKLIIRNWNITASEIKLIVLFTTWSGDDDDDDGSSA